MFLVLWIVSKNVRNVLNMFYFSLFTCFHKVLFQETLDFFVLALSKPLDVLYLAYVLNFLALKPYILIYFVLIKNVYSILLKHFVDASQETSD